MSERCDECGRTTERCAGDPWYQVDLETERRCLQLWKVDPPEGCPLCYAEPGEDCVEGCGDDEHRLPNVCPTCGADEGDNCRPGCLELQTNPRDWVAFNMVHGGL